MFALLRKVPWWGWAGLAVAILFFANWVSGSVYSGKLWNMVADQIRTDQSRIVETLEQTVTEREKELAALQDELSEIQRQEQAAEAETGRLKGLIREKDGEILALKKEREAIIVSTDPRELVDELHRMGYRSGRIRGR